ncbi:hypothetical protein Vadar_032528 [Vaccinium darrowii]|uniref:Uncharacterized protein n=1 Tax=Vaccinium darrowii TaxID=229202 RepID=A0ACB7ZGY5_9ERIC|nr:hypothetical protein Vadar_032528 [Vaccinium darrowii]
MGLVVYWYDFVCFGIVGVSFVGALYVIWRREGAGNHCNNERTLYESLLVVSSSGGIDGNATSTTATTTTTTSTPNPQGHVSSTQLWTSCWRGLHPVYLLGLRLTAFLITSGFLAWDIIVDDPSVLVYYTEWTFTLVIIYFGLGTIVSAHGCIVYYSKNPPIDINGDSEEFITSNVEEGSIPTSAATIFRAKETRGTHIKLQSHHNQEAIQQRAGFWGYLMQASYQTCAGAVIITDLVFWCIILPFLPNVHLQLNLLMGSMHTLNAVFLLLDTAVNSLPFPWFRLAYFVLWSCCYVIFQWVIHACGYSMWPYPFLELSTPWAPLWYFCLAVVHIPCYGLYSLLIRAKISIFSRFFPQAFVKSF